MNKMKKVGMLICVSFIFGFSKPDSITNTPTIETPSTPIVKIQHPTVLGLIPGSDNNQKYRRLYLPIIQIGSKPVQINLVFDTGSEGIVMDAKAILPPELLADTGIVLNHKDSILFDGMTITSKKIEKPYGIASYARSYYGNVAYASIKIGDRKGNIITNRMPFLLVYKGEKNDTKASTKLDMYCDGICGVYSTGNPKIGYVISKYDLKSPFAYLSYGKNVDAGFMLSPLNKISWAQITNKSGGIRTYSLLTIGITEEAKKDFILQNQYLNRKNLYPPFLIGDLTYPGHQAKSRKILLDTGMPTTNMIYDPTIEENLSFISSDNMIIITTPEGVNLTYNPNKNNNVHVKNKGLRYSFFGIDFFVNNSIMLDYTTHQIGINTKPFQKALTSVE